MPANGLVVPTTWWRLLQCGLVKLDSINVWGWLTAVGIFVEYDTGIRCSPNTTYKYYYDTRTQKSKYNLEVLHRQVVLDFSPFF